MRVRWLFAVLFFCATFALGQTTNNAQQCASTTDPALSIQYCTAAINDASSLSADVLAMCYHNRALAYYLEQQYNPALADVNQALRIHPGVAISLSLRGGIEATLHDYNLAIPDFKAAIVADKTPTDDDNTLLTAYLELSSAYVETRHYDKAIEAASAALGVKPNDFAAYWARALAYRGKLDYAHAAQDIQSAINLKPTFFYLYNSQADVYENTRQWDKVYADFNKSLQIDPNASSTYRGRAWAEWEQDNGDKAMADAGKALQLNPESTSALQLEAQIYLSRGDFWSAQNNLQKAVALEPKEPYYVLWRHIALAHGFIDDHEDFAHNTAALDFQHWPGPILSYYLGKITRAQLLAQVDTPDRARTLVRKCESSFYIGEHDLAKHRTVAATALFRQAINFCPVTYIEYTGARMELELLAKQAPHTARKPANATRR